MRKIVVLLGFLCQSALAAVDTTSIASAVSCNATPNTASWVQHLTETFGKPVRREQGAVWFRATGDLWGASIREVFVSVTAWHGFVGVVLDEKPSIIAERISTSRSFPTNLFPVTDSTGSYWIGSDGRSVMWHAQKYTKVFCAAGGNLKVRDF